MKDILQNSSALIAAVLHWDGMTSYEPGTAVHAPRLWTKKVSAWRRDERKEEMKWKVFTGTSAYLQASVATGKTCIIHSIDQCNTENWIADQTPLQRCLHEFPLPSIWKLVWFSDLKKKNVNFGGPCPTSIWRRSRRLTSFTTGLWNSLWDTAWIRRYAETLLDQFQWWKTTM